MDAAMLLSSLRDHGIELRTDGRNIGWRPKESVTPAQVAAIKDHKPLLMALLMAEDPEVAWRVEAMRTRLPAGPKPFHTFATAKDVPRGGGGCLSCGDPVADRTAGLAVRCLPCAHAAQLLLDEARKATQAPSLTVTPIVPPEIAAREDEPTEATDLPIDERERWTTDPRPDLAEDSALWSRLLTMAYDRDVEDPDGLFGVLHGFRGYGAGLVVAEGRVCLVAGEMGDAYAAQRREWLVPHAFALTKLLADITEQLPPIAGTA